MRIEVDSFRYEVHGAFARTIEADAFAPQRRCVSAT